MKQIITTRLMHWKKHWISLIFWLLFPVIATISITLITGTLQEDANVPVGIVQEEHTDAAEELIQEIKSTPFIRMELRSEEKALSDLEKHALDSVFIIHEGFQDNVRQDNRQQLITSYQTNLSFAYSPVKEMILSYVQQETGRSKAAFVIKELEKQYDGQEAWTIEEIMSKSREIQQDENLLDTAFSFHDAPAGSRDNPRLFPVWEIWAIAMLLSTLLIFDWVMKEKQSRALLRLAFSRKTLKSYLLQNFIVYSVVLLMVDFFTVSIIYFLFGEWVSLMNLLVYRLFVCIAAFLFAQFFRNVFLYYIVSFALVLIVGISSGVMLPSGIGGSWSWFDPVNPLAPLFSGKYISLWSVLVTVFAVIWLFRKERYDA
ncbi:ABC transporter permease [Lentibacillus salinarum]|uniref:ABC transporter permease n=1 Tax=Lentibacillus salinarum TaxID=446820 RepID=A0ABW3ZUY5_9BACI